MINSPIIINFIIYNENLLKSGYMRLLDANFVLYVDVGSAEITKIRYISC